MKVDYFNRRLFVGVFFGTVIEVSLSIGLMRIMGAPMLHPVILIPLCILLSCFNYSIVWKELKREWMRYKRGVGKLNKFELFWIPQEEREKLKL